MSALCVTISAIRRLAANCVLMPSYSSISSRARASRLPASPAWATLGQNGPTMVACAIAHQRPLPPQLRGWHAPIFSMTRIPCLSGSPSDETTKAAIITVCACTEHEDFSAPRATEPRD